MYIFDVFFGELFFVKEMVSFSALFIGARDSLSGELQPTLRLRHNTRAAVLIKFGG